MPIDDIWIFLFSLHYVSIFIYMSPLYNELYVIILSIKSSKANLSFDIFQKNLINFIFFSALSQDLSKHVMIFFIPTFQKVKYFMISENSLSRVLFHDKQITHHQKCITKSLDDIFILLRLQNSHLRDSTLTNMFVIKRERKI